MKAQLERGKAEKGALNNDSIDLMGKMAIFEGPFSIDWLLSLTGIKASSALKIVNSAIQNQTIKETETGTYCFCSQGKKEAARTQFDEALKQELHQKIILILKEESLEDAGSWEEMAYHLKQVGENFEASRWLLKTGDHYNEKADFPIAIACYRKTIDILRDIRNIDADGLFINTVIKVQNIFSFRRDSQWVAEILNEAYQRAESNGQKAFQSLIKLYQAITMWHQGYYAEAKITYDRVWATSESIDDPRIMQLMVSISVHFLFWHCRFKDAVEMYEQNIQDVVSYPKGMFPLYSSITVAHSYAIIGQANTGLGMLESIFAHSLKIKRYTIAGNALVNIAQVLLMLGRFEEALQTLDKAKNEVPLSDGYLESDISQVLAFTLMRLNRTKEAKTVLQAYFKILKERDLVRRPSYYLLVIAFNIKQETFPQVGGLFLEEEIERAMSSENLLYKGIAIYYQAFIQKERGESDKKIMKNLNQALELLEESGHEVEIARVRIEMTRLLLSMGESEKAAENLEKVAGIKSSGKLIEIPADLKFLVEKPPSKRDLLQDILKLGQDMVTIRDNKELVKYIVKTVNAMTGAERGAIFMLKPESSGDDMILRAAKNLTHDDVSRTDFVPSLEIIRKVAVSGIGVLRKIEQKPLDSDLPFNTIRSCICVPMVTKKKTVGVLYHDNRFLSSAFKKDDLKTLTYFAALAGIAIDNAEAYDEIRRLNSKLTEEKKYYREQHLDSMHIGSFVGKSPAIRSLLKKVNKVSNTDTTVLILGESGVGKELIAGTILDNSSRADKPFICVNCSAFSESLIASELFGHEKGAFTGANDRRIGRFELADGGTLFLDEIGDIPMETQVRLLRILQTKQFERVGGTKTLKSDFRLITATNQDLVKLVAEGRFREDLYYRLNVFPIHVPPLHKRKEDIPLLASFFLQNFSKKTGKFFNKLSDVAIKSLCSYHWPGNVRELENIIERSVVMSSEPDLQLPELKDKGNSTVEDSETVSMAEMEKRHLIRALEQTNWKIRGPGGAAELLDMHYSTLRSRIRKHGIEKRLMTVH